METIKNTWNARNRSVHFHTKCTRKVGNKVKYSFNPFFKCDTIIKKRDIKRYREKIRVYKRKYLNRHCIWNYELVFLFA